MSMHGVDEGWMWAQKPEIPQEAEDLIRSGWADRTAYGIAGQHPEWSLYVDDLAQEARYIMWDAAQKWRPGGEIIPFLKQRGRWRIYNIVKGEKNFVGTIGRKTSGGNRKEDVALAEMRVAIQNFRQVEHREPTPTELGKILGIPRTTAITRKANLHKVPYGAETRVRSLDDLMEIGFEAVASQDYIGEVLTSYHDGEVMEALAALPQVWREYVYLRFWEGLSDERIAALLHVDVRKGWKTKVAPALAETLHRLADA